MRDRAAPPGRRKDPGIAGGLGRAAAILGTGFRLYRPAAAAEPATNPLAGPALATIMAGFDQGAGFTFSTPQGYAAPLHYGLFDPTGCAVGDYLVGDGATYFIAALEPFKPALCVKTERVLSFTRAAPPAVAGLGSYSGRTADTEETVLAGWPASILLGGRSEAVDEAGRLPDADHAPGWEIRLPALAGVALMTADRATDDLGRSYTISGAELTDHGWRISATQTVA